MKKKKARPRIVDKSQFSIDRYLLIQNEDDLYRLALEILDWRFGGEKNNYGYYVLERPEEPPKSNVLSSEEITKLPSEDLKKYAQQQRISYEKSIRSYRDMQNQYDAVRDALAKKRR